jgi:Uri superfamily endonuclease
LSEFSPPPVSPGGGEFVVMPTPPTHVDLPCLPRHKGSYMLLLEMPVSRTMTVGRLGPLDFAEGFYIYVGSAHGPGGLAARLGHHLRQSKRCHWHIDYLRLRAPVVAVWAGWGAAAQCLNECKLADLLARQAFLRQPFKGFGSSDCTCFSHLLHWPTSEDVEPPFSNIRLNAITRLDKVFPLMTRLFF